MTTRQKIYIDTSVWNIALETNREHSKITNEFLNSFFLNKNYTFVISELVETEVSAAYDLRKQELLRLLNRFKPEVVLLNNQAIYLANKYIQQNLIPRKFTDDAIHIAIASVYHCNFLASWNFKHIVRAKVIQGVHMINLNEGYGLLEIVSPEQFMGKER